MSKSQKAKIIISIVCISFIQGLQYTVSPVLSQIHKYYPDVSISLVQMLITAPSLLAMVIAVISGWLVVKISKKKLLLAGCFIAGISGFVPFLSDSFDLLFFSRILYGVGLGLATALNTAVVADFFEGEERISVMGIQAASIGAGMFIETTLCGALGTYGFENVNFVHIIGFVSMFLLAWLLPDTGKARVTSTEKIRLNKEVFLVSFLGALEFLMLISFTTNISMHISGKLAGSTAVSGVLTGIFSGSQIVMGLVLGFVTKVTRKYTLPVAMLSFALGAIILVCYPSNYFMLMLGAVFCGFSQGMFIPQAMCDVSNAVKPVATAMAAACFTCAMCMGQLFSPTVLNAASKLVFGDVTTTHVYLIAAVGMTVIAVTVIILKISKKESRS
jgi:predicted MFS family arabinose efflux permease